MPNRIIREASRWSHSLAQLSNAAARSWWSLNTVFDDFGRYYGDEGALYSAAFPIGARGMTPKVFSRSLRELLAVDCIRFYELDGRRYVYVPAWDKHQHTRAKDSRFPDPLHASANTCSQTQANVPVVVVGDENRESKTKTVRPLNAGPSCVECHAALEELNRQTGRHYTGSGEGLRSLHARHQEHGMPAVLRVIRVKSGAWLNDPKMSKFLRPETLFRLTKFDGYLNEPERVRAGEELPSVRDLLAEVKS